MKTNLKLAGFLLLSIVALTSTLNAQFNIKIPKIGQPKPTPTPATIATPAPVTTPTPPANNGGQINAGGTSELRKPQATENPVLLQTSLDVRCDLENRYWKLPNESNYTSWIPQVRFKVFYKSNVTLRLQAEYFTPDGKSWFTEQLTANVSNGNYQTVELISSRAGDRFTNVSTTAVGTYGVKITNTRDNAVMFEGKFKVNKYKYGPAIPMFKNQYSFYVEQDWNLPIGYVWLDFANDQFSPLVKVGLWFKNDDRPGDFEARLFYNDQQIATTDDMGDVSNNESRFPNIIEDKVLAYWKRWDFTWYKARFKIPGGGMSYPQAKFLNNMPGEYTVKVYYKAQMVREVKFSVANGNLVDNGIASQNNINDTKIILPVKILPGTEKWNANAWKTDAFYGHPLSGFTLP